MSKFKVGDVVVLKSGSPRMTVKFDNKGEYIVNWFLDGKVESAMFLEDQLEIADDDDGSFI